MSRPRKEFPPKKSRFIGFKVTEDMYDIIFAEAEKAKMSVSEYCRKIVTDHKIMIHQETVFDSSELLKALGDMGRIGGNLNQIAHHLNEGLPLYEDMRKEIYRSITDIKEIRDNIRSMAGEYRGNTETHSN